MTDANAFGGPAGPPPAGDDTGNGESQRDQPPPASGWEIPQPEPEPDPFAAFGRALLAAIPPELIRAMAKALKELLAAFRTLLEWLIDRLSRPRGGDEPPTVRDIPIS